MKQREASLPTPPHKTSQGFLRPSNYTPNLAQSEVERKPSTTFTPSASHPQSPRPPPKSDGLRDIAGAQKGKKRPPIGSGSITDAQKGVKRVKVDLSATPPVKVEHTKEDGQTRDIAVDIDAREREMKAAKKREKKMKRKAKGEVAVK